jgi:hypothetical protein
MMTQPAPSSQHRYIAASITLLVVAALIGCGHSEPFGTQDFGTEAPRDPTSPVQLTLNRGHDRRAAWLPDGSAILYSTELSGSRDHDMCLAELPPTGGRQRRLTCDVTPNGGMLTESLESAAPAADGRLAYVAGSGERNGLVPDFQQLSLATISEPGARTSLLSIPYTIPGSRTHGGLSQLRWLGSNRLVYLGEAVTMTPLCDGCEKDTLRSGIEAVQLDLAASGTPQVIPGTTNASGVSPGASEDEVYYTLGGDTKVYRETLSSGAISVAYDFGAQGIARDVHVVGNLMTAVVGGRVHFGIDPSLGPTQWDSGGIVHVVHLSDGSDNILPDPTGLGLFRRPQISPSGSQLVAERYPLIITIFDTIADTSLAREADLYLMGQP